LQHSGIPTARLLDALYDVIADSWFGDVFHADDLHARNYATVALSRFDDDALFDLLDDLGWSGSLRLPAMMADEYEQQVRKAMRKRLSPRVLKLLHRLRKGAQRSAA
jgi:hypothetical protein